MSDYGPPPGPSGPPGPPGAPFGPPPGATSTQTPAPAGAHSGAAQQITMLSYAAGVLGLLSFVWGFLDWFGGGVGSGLSGYSVGGGPAGAIVGLALVAGLLAAATAFEKKALGVGPAAIAVAGLLVAFGVLVGHGDSADTKIGLILAFITAILQAAALAVAWLLTTGKLASLGGGSSSKPANQWQGQNAQGPGSQGPQGPGPQGQFGGFAGEQGQFGPPPGYGPPPSQDSAPSYGPPPGPPSGYGPPPQGPAPSYGPPSQEPAPSYGPPSQEPAPSYGPPSGPPAGFGPPPQAPPQQPPPSNEDDSSRTQVLPRFQPDQNSTQQGIPIFDPQARPDDRPNDEPRH